MELNEIEHKIACGEMNAAQVFTQMKQHIPEKKGTALFLCDDHGGCGFVSDCSECKKEKMKRVECNGVGDNDGFFEISN
jgi:hypothetical protein